MESTVEMTLTIIALSFWILFPIGMFLSVSHVDKHTDQIVRLDNHRHYHVNEYDDPAVNDTFDDGTDITPPFRDQYGERDHHPPA